MFIHEVWSYAALYPGLPLEPVARVTAWAIVPFTQSEEDCNAGSE